MNLQQEWQQMSEELIAVKQNDIVSKFNLDVQSKDLLQDLIYKLKWKLRWIRIIDLPILAIALFAQNDLKLLLLATFIIYEVFRWFSVRELRKLRTQIDYTTSTKNLLEHNLQTTLKILKIETIFGYATAPFVGPIGFLCGKLTTHKTFSSVFELPNIYVQLASFTLLGVLVIVLGNLFNQIVLKKLLIELRSKIAAFSEQ